MAGVRVPRRGDVYWVALDPTLGSEIRKMRPAVIVSNDAMNRHGHRVVVVPLTSNVEDCYPGEALVQVKGRPARALGDQLRSIDKIRLRRRQGTLSRDEIERHLRHEPERTSRSRIKKLKGSQDAAYRLRVGEYRVFYDVTDDRVIVVAVLHERETAEFYREE